MIFDSNLVSADLSSRLIEVLPTLAENMPEIDELRTLQINNGNASSEGAFDPLFTFLAKMLALAENLGIPIPKERGKRPHSDG